MDSSSLYNLVNRQTCFKFKSYLINLILTNKKYSLKNTHTFETGLNDHHHQGQYSTEDYFQKI